MLEISRPWYIHQVKIQVAKMARAAKAFGVPVILLRVPNARYGATGFGFSCS